MTTLPPIYYTPPMAEFVLQNTGLKNINITGDLDVWKRALITVTLINPSSLKEITVLAMLDTGAVPSCISVTVVNELLLFPVSNNVSTFVAYQGLEGEFIAELKIKDYSKSLPLKFSAMPLINDSINAIIGTEILSNFEFTYNNPEGKFTLKSKV